MRKVKALLIGGLATVSLMAVGAIPAAAADTQGTLAIVNGIPGKKVDVCLNGKEIRSGLRYGDKVQKPLVKTGNKNLKLYARDPRTCRGRLVGQKQFPLPPAGDLTIVVTKNAPRVVVFDNAALGEIPPLGAPTPYAPVAIRHAADVAAALEYRYWGDPGSFPVSPSAIFTKGQQYATSNAAEEGFLPTFVFQLRATVAGSSEVITAPVIEAIASHRLEWILVGTNHANARWVFMERLVSLPSL